jgi:gluconolactonase
MDRRKFLAAGVTAAATAAAGKALAQTVGPYGATAVPLSAGLPLGPLPDTRYPDAHIQVIDAKRFPGGVNTGAVERVASGLRWAEGPVYFPAGGYLLFSDVPNNRLMRLSDDDNHLSVFRSPSMNSNGNTIDRQGRLITCEHAGRRVTRTEFDGTITVLADRFQGKRLGSPNDVAVAPDGSIWFSDPSYGIDGRYEGLKVDREQPGNFVYRIDPRSGAVTKALDGFDQPNGICFSPDGKRAYFVDSGVTQNNIRAFDVDLASGRLSNGRVFAKDFAPGNTDGLRCDTAGNVWCSMGWADPKEDGVRCYAPDGTLTGKIHLPETCANLAWGGQQRNRLYMCASTSVYAVYLNAQGA